MESFHETPELSVRLLQFSELSAEELSKLIKLINEAYLVGEAGICMPEMKRVSADALVQMIEQGSIIGLRIDGTYKGCIHVSLSPYDHTKKSGIFGMLAVADEPHCRGRGFGTLLVDAAERWAKEKGFSAMNLELLKPLHWHQAHKDRLENWYIRRGYVYVESRSLPYPEVLIIHEYDYKIFKKII